MLGRQRAVAHLAFTADSVQFPFPAPVRSEKPSEPRGLLIFRNVTSFPFPSVWNHASRLAKIAGRSAGPSWRHFHRQARGLKPASRQRSAEPDQLQSGVDRVRLDDGEGLGLTSPKPAQQEPEDPIHVPDVGAPSPGQGDELLAEGYEEAEHRTGENPGPGRIRLRFQRGRSFGERQAGRPSP
jgi:hypothetical protein